MPATPHADQIIALQSDCLVAIRNCLLSRDPLHIKEASAIAEASHDIDGYIQAGDLPGMKTVLVELELAITTPGGCSQPSVLNAVNALRAAAGFTPGAVT